MLISGPAEWGDVLLATGVKANVLQNGYNSQLKVSAMSLGPTVAITRYADVEPTSGFARGILDQPADTLMLHESKTDTSSRYQFVSWSRGSTEKCLLAIASTTCVEIWDVTVISDISAMLKGSFDCLHLQGLVWNPLADTLLVVSKTDILLVNASQPTLSLRSIYTDKSTPHAFGACSWSPCGLHFSLAQHHILHCFGWTSMDATHFESPMHNQFDVSSLQKGINGLRLDAGVSSVGPVAAVARVSPTVCILTTDRKVILEDIAHAKSGITTLNCEIRKTIEARTTSKLVLGSENAQLLTVQDEDEKSSSGVIDLMSMRASSSSSSAWSSLRILNHSDDVNLQQNISQWKPRSHVVLVEYKAGQWGITSILELPHLTSPDILVVQDIRVIIASSLSPRLVVAHLNVSDRLEWTVALSGELELPSTHVCRGLHLPARSPFVDVVSTEKRKHSMFFHAAANLEPQPIFLSKFKVPRRTRPQFPTSPAEIVQQSTAVAADQTPKSSVGSESKDLLELIVTKMSAMQTQLNARFDVVDEKLQQLTARVEQMERNGGTSGR